MLIKLYDPHTRRCVPWRIVVSGEKKQDQVEKPKIRYITELPPGVETTFVRRHIDETFSEIERIFTGYVRNPNTHRRMVEYNCSRNKKDSVIRYAASQQLPKSDAELIDEMIERQQKLFQEFLDRKDEIKKVFTVQMERAIFGIPYSGDISNKKLEKGTQLKIPHTVEALDQELEGNKALIAFALSRLELSKEIQEFCMGGLLGRVEIPIRKRVIAEVVSYVKDRPTEKDVASIPEGGNQGGYAQKVVSRSGGSTPENTR